MNSIMKSNLFNITLKSSQDYSEIKKTSFAMRKMLNGIY